MSLSTRAIRLGGLVRLVYSIRSVYSMEFCSQRGFALLFFTLFFLTTASGGAEQALEPYPREMVACRSKDECQVVPGPCDEWFILHRRHEGSLQAWIREKRAELGCVDNEKTRSPKNKKPAADCRAGLCEWRASSPSGQGAARERSQERILDSNQDSIQDRVDLWERQCANKERDQKVGALTHSKVRSLVQKLYSPLGWERTSALGELEALGAEALEAIPFILEQYQFRDVFSTSSEALCVVGDPPSSEALFQALGVIGSGDHPALPLLIQWLKDEKQGYRHSGVLKTLKSLGKRARPALPAIESLLNKAHSEGWTQERGLLALEVVGEMGAEAKSLLPRLRQWTEKAPRFHLLNLMIQIDPKNSETLKASRSCLKEKEQEKEKEKGDGGGRSLALAFLAQDSKEMLRYGEGLKQILLTQSSSSLDRSTALRAIQRMAAEDPKNLKPSEREAFRELVTDLTFENNENVRRLAALTLKDLDPTGVQSLAKMKKRVYEGFPSESQFVWKVIGSPETRIELLKSHFYFVTGQRVRFTDLKMRPENEALLVQCLENPACPNRTSALAALTLIKSQNSGLSALLKALMGGQEEALQWEASGAYLILFGEKQKESHGEHQKWIRRALALQEDALKKNEAVRRIDLEDVLAETPLQDRSHWKFLVDLSRTQNQPELVDAVLILGQRGDSAARELLQKKVSEGEKELALQVLIRLLLVRTKDQQWLQELNRMALKHPDRGVQELALINHWNLGL